MTAGSNGQPVGQVLIVAEHVAVFQQIVGAIIHPLARFAREPSQGGGSTHTGRDIAGLAVQNLHV